MGSFSSSAQSSQNITVLTPCSLIHDLPRKPQGGEAPMRRGSCSRSSCCACCGILFREVSLQARAILLGIVRTTSTYRREETSPTLVPNETSHSQLPNHLATYIIRCSRTMSIAKGPEVTAGAFVQSKNHKSMRTKILKQIVSTAGLMRVQLLA